ncbi:hypothetical protein P7K49_031512 [Saguinus oedipus]|uniref:Uncharacterized protein n=1 Tax=Saguinus oedipus TaxID=9490 RepID=A0ABQ9TZL5_SAGOE|nr:hypothetical protein P7K49_031512 [Saguinus oedipus]
MPNPAERPPQAEVLSDEANMAAPHEAPRARVTCQPPPVAPSRWAAAAGPPRPHPARAPDGSRRVGCSHGGCSAPPQLATPGAQNLARTPPPAPRALRTPVVHRTLPPPRTLAGTLGPPPGTCFFQGVL